MRLSGVHIDFKTYRDCYCWALFEFNGQQQAPQQNNSFELLHGDAINLLEIAFGDRLS